MILKSSIIDVLNLEMAYRIIIAFICIIKKVIILY